MSDMTCGLGQLCVMGWASWAFGGCFPAAVGAHSCVWMCTHAEATGAAVAAAADLTQSRSWRVGMRKLGRNWEREGPVPFCNSLYVHLCKKKKKKRPPRHFLLQLWVVACMLLWVLCSCTTSVLTTFILCFTARERRNIRSEGCEQIRGWAQRENIK